MVVVVDDAPRGSYRLWILDLSSMEFKPDFDWREEALSRVAARNLKWENSEEANDRVRVLFEEIRKGKINLGDPEVAVRIRKDRSKADTSNG